MNINEAFPSKFLRAADLQGRSARVFIQRIEMASMNDGKQKPIMYFQGKQKGLALNKTNASTIANSYGPNTDQWAGAEIELFPATVDFQGKMVEAIRVRVPPRQPVARPTQPAQPAPVNQPPVNGQEPSFNDDIPF